MTQNTLKDVINTGTFLRVAPQLCDHARVQLEYFEDTFEVEFKGDRERYIDSYEVIPEIVAGKLKSITVKVVMKKDSESTG